MKALHDLFIAESANAFDTGNVLSEAFSTLPKAATRERQSNLPEEVSPAHGQFPRPEKCEAIVSIPPQTAEILETLDLQLINAALMRAAQTMEHYEVASDGCSRAWVRVLGNQTAAQLFPLKKEESADRVLTGQDLPRANKPACGNSFPKNTVATPR